MYWMDAAQTFCCSYTQPMYRLHQVFPHMRPLIDDNLQCKMTSISQKSGGHYIQTTAKINCFTWDHTSPAPRIHTTIKSKHLNNDKTIAMSSHATSKSPPAPKASKWAVQSFFELQAEAVALFWLILQLQKKKKRNQCISRPFVPCPPPLFLQR